MPETFTPDEEQMIEGLVSAFSLSEQLPAAGVALTVNYPRFNVSFPPQPSVPYIGAFNVQAATRKEALDQVQSQLTAQIMQAKTAIDQWIAGMDNHHRYFELYQEAFRRAKSRL